MAPLVPFHDTYPPPGTTPTSCSLGAATEMVMPCEEASKLASLLRSTPATVRRRGSWPGRRPRDVPPPRLPAAATTIDVVLEGVEEGVVPALRPVEGVAGERHVDDRRRRCRPPTAPPRRSGRPSRSSTCCRCRRRRRRSAVAPRGRRRSRRCPRPCRVPRAARPPWVPCESSSPTGFCPFADPMPETSVPPTTTPFSSATEPSMPVSMTATFTPAPLLVVHACVKP